MKVQANPSTGFNWIVYEKARNDVFTLEAQFTQRESLEPPTVVDEDGDVMEQWSPPVGMGGHQFYTLTGSNVGEAAFIIAYARSWEFPGFEEILNKDTNSGNLIKFDVRVTN